MDADETPRDEQPRLAVAEHIRRQRWLSVGAILASIPVFFIAWTTAVLWFEPFEGPGLGIVLAGAALASALVLGGMILMARTDPRWSTQQAVTVYALIGLVIWLASGQELLIEGLLVWLLWPAVLLGWGFFSLGVYPRI